MTTIEELKTEREHFVAEQLKFNPNANKQVLKFIAEFMYKGTPDVSLEQSAETIYDTFAAGYCYYFAHMLELAFNRGKVCWAAPFGHFVWVDIDNTPYDISGVYDGEAETFIPERYLGDAVKDFKHVPDDAYNATDKEIAQIMERYKYDIKKSQDTPK